MSDDSKLWQKYCLSLYEVTRVNKLLGADNVSNDLLSIGAYGDGNVPNSNQKKLKRSYSQETKSVQNLTGCMDKDKESTKGEKFESKKSENFPVVDSFKPHSVPFVPKFKECPKRMNSNEKYKPPPDMVEERTTKFKTDFITQSEVYDNEQKCTIKTPPLSLQINNMKFATFTEMKKENINNASEILGTKKLKLFSPKVELSSKEIFNTAYHMSGLSKYHKTVNQGTKTKIIGKFISPLDDSNENLALKEKNNSKLELEQVKNIDPKMVEIMMNEIMDHDTPVAWDDIAGLEFVKKTLKEIVVWPMLRPDIFTGLRKPPKGILLFGPPGTGKTLIGKCIASQSKSTFFSISASSLGSKWIGEGEKLVRALFAVARCYQPAVIFIDEIDSLLSQRSDSEHESSRRIKTEFLVQLDGVKTSDEERLLIIGATNRPQELDEAARRRLVKRLYISLPEADARKKIITTLLVNHSNNLSEDDLHIISKNTLNYSGADMANLCKEAALGPIRSINFENISVITNDQVRAITLDDFLEASKQIKASVNVSDLQVHEQWNQKYGSSSI